MSAWLAKSFVLSFQLIIIIMLILLVVIYKYLEPVDEILSTSTYILVNKIYRFLRDYFYNLLEQQ